MHQQCKSSVRIKELVVANRDRSLSGRHVENVKFALFQPMQETIYGEGNSRDSF